MAVMSWSDQDISDITNATVGRTMSKQEFFDWVDAFTREHGQTPWQTGPFDAANNLIDHLIAKGDSERYVGQTGRSPQKNAWAGMYYGRYAAPTYTPAYRENSRFDEWQALMPGQMAAPYHPYLNYLRGAGVPSSTWYPYMRRPYYRFGR